MSKIIGVFPMFNTGGICVHAIDDAEDKVLASVNGENPEWCEMAEQPQEDTQENNMLESTVPIRIVRHNAPFTLQHIRSAFSHKNL